MIYNALRIAGILGAPGRGGSQSDISDGMLALNAMLDAWETERLMAWCELQFPFNLIANQQNYTIGQDGTPDWTAPRPLKIDRAGLVLNNVSPSTEIPMRVYTDQEWAAVTPKQLTSTQPTAVWYQKTVPNGIVTWWPVPQNPYPVNLYLWVDLQEVTDPSANIDLPPGYQSAIEYNLAVELAARFQERSNISQWSITKAHLTKETIKTINDEQLKMRVELAAMGTRGGSRGLYQILSNTYFNEP